MGMPSKPDQFLVFDLDGTISDPAVGIGRCINYALSIFGYPAISHSEISRYIGPPLDASFAQITGRTESTHVAELVATYRERYADVGYAENIVYDGIPQALEVLSAAQVPMGICTSKRSDFAERILDMFGLRQHFQFVSGGDIGIQKWQQLAALRAQQTIAPGATMIGDRAVDISAAKTNEMQSIGVLWGHGSLAELTATNPDHIFSFTTELEGLAAGK
jgi:phosphoglycolate phosphatase